MSKSSNEWNKRNKDKMRVYYKRWYNNHREEKIKAVIKYSRPINIANGDSYNGVLDPKLALGKGLISEYIVSKVLNDCIQYNVPGYFNAPYDFISKKYDYINVKSSKLIKFQKYYIWNFHKNINSKTPTYYFCVGFDENRYNIEHVWIIPGNSPIINDNGFMIYNTETALARIKQYEVDSIPYNNVYQNLDIYTLPEFRNLENNTEVNNTEQTDQVY